MVIYDRLGGTDLVRAYSDAGKRIIQDSTGDIYDEAVDLVSSNETYTESEEIIEPLEPE